MADQIDVAVVGAGPTGLALALQAADHGARVRVFERRSESFRPSRALIMHPRTLEVLRPLGVTGALVDRGDARPAAHLHLGSSLVRVRLAIFDLPDTAFPHLLLIRQADVEAVLGEALADRGVAVERGTEVVDVCARDDHAAVAVSQGPEVSARYVVGCDGPLSRVRASLGASWHGGGYRQEVVLADVELDGDVEPGVVHAAPGPGGLVFLFALGERATWRLLATRPAVPPGGGFGQLGSPIDPGELQGLIDRGGLDARITSVPWSARVPLQHRLAGSYRKGPLFIAGDAAHTHSPAGGQGMNTGIGDATNLGWKLAFAARNTGPCTDVLLDSYELERRPVARQVIALTDAVFWAEAATDPVPRAVRSAVGTVGPLLLPALLRQRRLLAEGVRLLGQLRVNYRASPLSLTGRSPRGWPRGGDRLGDAAVSETPGAARLHDLTAQPGLHLLLQRDAKATGSILTRTALSTHRLTGAGTAVAMIRPDGYVGFAGDAAEQRLLHAWLSLVGAPDPLGDTTVEAPAAERTARRR